MDVRINFYGERENGPPIRYEDKAFTSVQEADAWAQNHYKAYGARGYSICDRATEKTLEQWDERRNASWP